MKNYEIAKYNKITKAWETTRQYRLFREALEDITFEGVIAVCKEDRIYTKEGVPFELMYQWTQILTKKDLTKVYITRKKDMYLIREVA